MNGSCLLFSWNNISESIESQESWEMRCDWPSHIVFYGAGILEVKEWFPINMGSWSYTMFFSTRRIASFQAFLVLQSAQDSFDGYGLHLKHCESTDSNTDWILRKTVWCLAWSSGARIMRQCFPFSKQCFYKATESESLHIIVVHRAVVIWCIINLEILGSRRSSGNQL